MLSIHLNKLLFYSYHGVHEEEKILGGNFQVDVVVRYKPLRVPIKNLNETVNYVSIYALVKERMAQPTELLETIATELASEIMNQFAVVEETEVSIIKLNPPITAMQGSVGVSYALKRDQ